MPFKGQKVERKRTTHQRSRHICICYQQSYRPIMRSLLQHHLEGTHAYVCRHRSGSRVGLTLYCPAQPEDSELCSYKDIDFPPSLPERDQMSSRRHILNFSVGVSCLFVYAVFFKMFLLLLFFEIIITFSLPFPPIKTSYMSILAFL